MNKKWWYSSLLFCLISNVSYGDAAPLGHVDSQHIQQYKTTIKSSAKKYKYIRFGLKGAAAVAIVYLMLHARGTSAQTVAGMLTATEVLEVRKLLQSRHDTSWLSGIRSVGAIIVQQLFAYQIAQMLATKLETLMHYPGTFDWFIKHHTDISSLLDEYEKKAEILCDPVLYLKSQRKRAQEFITSQWSSLVADVEQVLGYINYIQETTTIDTEECTTIISYIINCTNEVADTISAHPDDPDPTLVCNKIKQFKAELTSLFNRFDRLCKN